MTLTLSKRVLVSNEASVEDCLRACGAQLWSRTALRQYRHEQQRRARKVHLAKLRAGIVSHLNLCCTFVVTAIAALVAFNASPAAGGTIFGCYLCGTVIFQLEEWPRWQTNELSADDLYWHDGVRRYLPEPVQNVVDGVRAFFIDARFAVSFIGQDPVLHVLLSGQSYNALVWDVNADATITIIPPPSG